MEFEYKGKTVQVLPPIKRYVNAIERKLRLPWKQRARVMSDFSTSLCARQEAGESWEQIMSSLGSPAKVAAELNEQMKAYTYRKSPWRFVFLGVAVLSVVWLVGYIIWPKLIGLWVASQLHSIVVTAGSDIPTSIFFNTRQHGVQWVHILIAAVLLVASLIGFWCFSHSKPKQGADENDDGER